MMTVKLPRLSRVFLLALGSLLLIQFACTFPRPQSSGLHVNESSADGSIRGSYQIAGDLGGDMVLFSVSADGQAVFRLKDAPESQTLIVNMDPLGDSHLSWQGSLLDGMGALSLEEQVLLDNMLESPLAHGLAMIPLDIACYEKDTPDPLQLAALLYPLQMRFKYQFSDRAAATTELIALSQCSYSGDDEETEETEKKASWIMMTPSNPVPVVLGYFPFDETGAVESPRAAQGNKLACLGTKFESGSVTLAADSARPVPNSFAADPIEDEWGPCYAKCRGACGPDCTHDNCTFRVEDRCEKNQDGDNSGFLSLVSVYDCGLHPACIQHDACYDDCNQRHGCDTWAATFCMHGMTLVSAPLESFSGSYLSCDSATLLEEDPANVKDWVRGYGPQPTRQIYEYHDKEHSFEYDPVTCPLKTEDEPDDASAEEAVPGSGTTYVGTGDWYAEKWEEALEEIPVNEIVISIAGDGTVTGSLKRHDIEITYYNEQDDCSGHWEHKIHGEFSGQLDGTSGLITLTETIQGINISTCPDINPGYSGTADQQVEIEIHEDVLTGTVQSDPEDPDDLWNFTITAYKQ